jgi:hypothetical protein
MNTKIMAVVGLSFMSAAAMCQEEPPSGRSIDWFVAHPDQVSATIRWCGEHLDEAAEKYAAGDRSCSNAASASQRQSDADIARANAAIKALHDKKGD